MQDVKEGKEYNFPREEEVILEFWDRIKAFEGQLERTKGKEPFSFYDGPPFATGLPHYGHLLAGTIKDIVTRYASSTGHYCPRRFGWDCHGLPVENEINNKLGIKGRSDVLKMGIEQYNEECRSIVMRYSHEWEKTVRRAGRWIDFKNDYKTLNLEFMETVWWVFGQLHKQGLVYKGLKVMPYSWKLSTSISNSEAENYKEVDDPSVMVSFPLDSDPDNAEMVAWTTTPWTLPSNLALCVHPDFEYVRAREPATGRVYIVAESRLPSIPGAVPQEKKSKKAAATDAPAAQGWQVLSKVKGKELAGKTYQPLFPYFKHLKQAAQNGSSPESGPFRVVSDKYVTDSSGTGIVHQAPFFGEDDLRVCLMHGIIQASGPAVCPIDADGRFTNEVTDFAGRLVKKEDLDSKVDNTPDKDIIKMVKAMGRLVNSGSVKHLVPVCPRTDTPLIYKAVDSWFIKVEQLREELWENTAQTYWVPEKVRDGRFKMWLANSRDWAVSRSRFWGTPIPIWASEDGEEIVVVSSVEELRQLTGTTSEITDLHRHKIDGLTIPSRQGKGQLRRVEDVFDCWFESGSMPYGQLHYPFENRQFFEGSFPADFVAEGIDQTRGWFYSLMVLSTMLFKKPAFKNLVCNGMVLAEDGKKMSKRLKNYPDPVEILNEYGADAMRLYLITSPVVRGDNLAFKKQGVYDVIRNVFLPWYNAYRFLIQNALRQESEMGASFDPTKVDLSKATNVLDRWIAASTRTLTAFMQQEMAAYHLYTVVPRLVKFIDDLTNVYVRYNRRRLKGGKSREDCSLALASLYHVLLTLSKLMAPFTPFFCETMYQNLKRALPEGEPESVHWCDFPKATTSQAGDREIEASVDQMQRVIELARAIRERKSKPLKQPLRHLTVVHPDPAVLRALEGELSEFVYQETNVRELSTCDDPERFGVIRAEPVFSTLGKKYKEAMPRLKAAIKDLKRGQIAQFEETGSLIIEGCELERGDLKVLNDFRPPEGSDPADLDAAVDGRLMAILDLRVDDSLAEEGLGREVVNRVQKLRKKAGLAVGDAVNMWLGMSPALAAAVRSQAEAMAGTLGQLPRSLAEKAAEEVVIAEEKHSLAVNDKQEALHVVLTRPLVGCSYPDVLQAASGDEGRAAGIVAWLRGRDPQHLAQMANHGKGAVDFVLDGQRVSLQPGKHFHSPQAI